MENVICVSGNTLLLA